MWDTYITLLPWKAVGEQEIPTNLYLRETKHRNELLCTFADGFQMKCSYKTYSRPKTLSLLLSLLPDLKAYVNMYCSDPFKHVWVFGFFFTF